MKISEISAISVAAEEAAAPKECKSPFMMKLAEKCIAHDKEIAGKAEVGGYTAVKYNVEITDKMVERIMAAEHKKDEDESSAYMSKAFIPPFFDEYVTAVCDYAF